MKGRVVILTIGGHEIGMGHVIRCLSLAKALKRDKIDVKFILKNGYDSDEYVSSVSEKIKSEGFDVSLEDNVKIFDEGSPQVLFIDFPHHVRRSGYVNDAKKRGIVSVVFDDMLLNGEAADIIINPSLVSSQQSAVSSQHADYSGAEYTVINDSFYPTLPPLTKGRNNGDVKNILITMGGSDPTQQTEKILDALVENRIDTNIDVVIGMAYKGARGKGQGARGKIHYNVKNMAELMRKADMAFVAGGITLYEAASIGLPVIVIAQDRYQELVAKEFQKKGFGMYLGYFSDVTKDMIYKGFKELLNDYDKRSSMSDTGRKIVDGKGVDRVAEIIKKQGLGVRG